MICPSCDKDSRKKDRTDDTCPHCGQRFAFDPDAPPRVSDKRFQGAIDTVSADGAVRFLPEHVQYEIGRQLAVRDARARRVGCSFAAGTGLIAGMLALVAGPCGAGVALLGGLAGWLVARHRLRRAGLERPTVLGAPLDVLEGLWRRWQALHPDIPGLIVPRPPVAPPDREELLAYSFDRAVICDDPRVVDLLVANRFHFENNCALLTEDGYPEAIFETVRTMLRNNPDITVFALHHATPRGLGLAQRLRDSPEWFAGIGRVVDVGLRPEHADELRGTWEPRGAGDATIAPLDPGWTEAWTLSLFALRPEQLVRRLYRAMNRQEVSRMAPGGGEVLLLPGFIGDAAPSSGDGDGFG